MNPSRFRTSDGYTFYLVDGEWVDSLDPYSVDMVYDNRDGHPIDDQGIELEGIFLEGSNDHPG